MTIYIAWIMLSLLAGSLGRNRSIEFSGAFTLSLILSPLVGLVVVLMSQEISDKASRALVSGEKLLKKQKYDRAISAFHTALERKPYSITAHYNLARAYSLKNKPKEALYHLNKAFENGYFNLDSLQQSPDLQNLRSSEGFKAFEPNRFMLGYFLNRPRENKLLQAS